MRIKSPNQYKKVRLECGAITDDFGHIHIFGTTIRKQFCPVHKTWERIVKDV